MQLEVYKLYVSSQMAHNEFSYTVLQGIRNQCGSVGTVSSFGHNKREGRVRWEALMPTIRQHLQVSSPDVWSCLVSMAFQQVQI